MLVVWIAMMGGDTCEAARTAASKFDDKRVQQFYDPQKEAGKAFARSLGHDGRVAWDFYLFYAPLSEWEGRLPQPEVYMHQLRSGWSDQGRLVEKDKLTEKLTETMRSLFP